MDVPRHFRSFFMQLERIESNAWLFCSAILVLGAGVSLRFASNRCAHGQCKVRVLHSPPINPVTTDSTLRSCELGIVCRQHYSTWTKVLLGMQGCCTRSAATLILMPRVTVSYDRYNWLNRTCRMYQCLKMNLTSKWRSQKRCAMQGLFSSVLETAH